MSVFPGFLLTVVKTVISSNNEIENINIVVRKPFSHLARELRQAFEGNNNVNVFVDNRKQDRRLETKMVSPERRESDRRLVKEELAEVVVAT